MVLRGVLAKRVMTVYEWTETEHFFVAQVRPTELFDVDTRDSLPEWESWNNPDVDHGPEGSLWAVNLATGQPATFAYFIDKRAGKEYAERTLDRWPDKFVSNDARNLGRLRKLA